MILLVDRRNAGRAFALSALIFAVSLGISAASDEGDIAWLTRLTRALPLAPLCAAAAVWLTLASARAKMEALALEASGRSPSWNAAGPVVGGAVFALAAAVLLLGWQRLDVAAIFPSFASAPRIEWNGSTFVDSAHGIAIDENGVTSPRDKEASHAAAPSEKRERIAASVALGLAGIAFALLAAVFSRRVSSRGALAVLGIGLATILAFDAAASGRAQPAIVIVPPLGLFIYAAIEYLRSAWLLPSK
ncbi:MAG: hypothetical protein ACRELY_17280 [Polyangiaceae bacterium]